VPTMSNIVAATALSAPSDSGDRPLAGRAWPANPQRGVPPRPPAASGGGPAETVTVHDCDIGHTPYGSDTGRYATRGIVLAILLALPVWGALGLAAMWLFRT
jgi:hypothetical protein